MPQLILGILLLLTAASAITSVYFYNTVISTKTKKKAKPAASREQEASFSEDKLFFEEAKPEDVYMQSRDGLLLHALSVENDTKKWVIICHGYSLGARYTGSFAKLFHDIGFSVLAVDLRGHGESQGTYRGMGWHDSFDVADWAELTDKRYRSESIVLFGISMGGATVMMASGHSLPGSVKAVIEDCGYSSVKAELKYNLHKKYHLPSFPIMNFFSLLTKKFAGYSVFDDGDAILQLKKTSLPVLFIHGEEDDFVPFSMLDKVYKAAGGPKSRFTVPKAGHGKSFRTDPEGYRDAVYSFLYRYVRIDQNA